MKQGHVDFPYGEQSFFGQFPGPAHRTRRGTSHHSEVWRCQTRASLLARFHTTFQAEFLNNTHKILTRWSLFN